MEGKLTKYKYSLSACQPGGEPFPQAPREAMLAHKFYYVKSAVGAAFHLLRPRPVTLFMSCDTEGSAVRLTAQPYIAPAAEGSVTSLMARPCGGVRTCRGERRFTYGSTVRVRMEMDL